MELIDRLKASKYPSRELDCMIREYLYPRYTPACRVTYYGEPTGEHVDPDDGDFVKAPTYTASIDAAMTLVVPGINPVEILLDAIDTNCADEWMIALPSAICAKALTARIEQL